MCGPLSVGDGSRSLFLGRVGERDIAGKARFWGEGSCLVVVEEGQMVFQGKAAY